MKFTLLLWISDESFRETVYGLLSSPLKSPIEMDTPEEKNHIIKSEDAQTSFDSPSVSSEPLAQDISFLDTLGLHFLCLDSEKQPTFISSAAARFFELDNPELVASGAMLIAPLIELACLHQYDAASSVLKLAGLAGAPHMKSLTLRTAKGQQRSVVAFVELLYQMEEAGRDSIHHDFKTAVFFYDLSPLDTVSMILKQARICRELYLSLIVKQLEMAEQLTRLSGNKRSSGSSSLYFQYAGMPMEEDEATDLLGGIHKAVQILDHCVLKSVSFNIRANTSGIVAIKEPDFLRVVIGLVNQACEFIGVCGKMLLETEFVSNESSRNASFKGESNESSTARTIVHLRAERYSPLPNHVDPLAFFVYQQCIPHYFGRFSAPANADASPLLSSILHAPTYLRSAEQPELTAEVLTHFYEKLSNVTNILNAHRGILYIKSVDKNTLVFSVELPLAQMRR